MGEEGRGGPWLRRAQTPHPQPRDRQDLGSLGGPSGTSNPPSASFVGTLFALHLAFNTCPAPSPTGSPGLGGRRKIQVRGPLGATSPRALVWSFLGFCPALPVPRRRKENFLPLWPRWIPSSYSGLWIALPHQLRKAFLRTQRALDCCHAGAGGSRRQPRSERLADACLSPNRCLVRRSPPCAPPHSRQQSTDT